MRLAGNFPVPLDPAENSAYPMQAKPLVPFWQPADILTNIEGPALIPHMSRKGDPFANTLSPHPAV